MKTYSVIKLINASPETIWSILTDSSRYPEWNTTVTKLEGTIAPGNQLNLYSTISPEKAFSIKVVEFEPSTKMVWRSGMPFGLFQGIRTFTLAPTSNGQTTFHMEECFSGLMSPLIIPSIPDLTPSFEEFAEGLKTKVESTP
ncbi:MAG: SRPBCC domain-containing protein [Cyanobacteria bacterium J06638_22]